MCRHARRNGGIDVSDEHGNPFKYFGPTNSSRRNFMKDGISIRILKMKHIFARVESRMPAVMGYLYTMQRICLFTTIEKVLLIGISIKS